MRHSESGNVFFYLFLGVALFAALAFAVSNGSRTSFQTLSEDTRRLYATDILDYADAIAKAVIQLRLRGIPESQLSFETGVLAGYANGNCGSDTCMIFAPGGGGITYTPPSEDWLDPAQSGAAGYGEYYFTGNSCIIQVGAGGLSPTCNADGEDNEELILVLPYVKRDLCAELNKKTGVANPSDLPPLASATAFDIGANKFTGSFTNSHAIGAASGDAAEFDGKLSGCLEGAGTPPNGTYHFYEVLLPR